MHAYLIRSVLACGARVYLKTSRYQQAGCTLRDPPFHAQDTHPLLPRVRPSWQRRSGFEVYRFLRLQGQGSLGGARVLRYGDLTFKFRMYLCVCVRFCILMVVRMVWVNVGVAFRCCFCAWRTTVRVCDDRGSVCASLRFIVHY